MFVVDAPARRRISACRPLSALLATNGWLAVPRAGGEPRGGGALLVRADRGPRRARRGRCWRRSPRRWCSARVTGLVQAYGLVDTSLASLTRAPGGTFGNRNFMAHLVAIGLPVLLLRRLEARSRGALRLGAVGIVLAAAALVLSRSRAAWLGAGACGVFLVVEGLWVGRLWAEQRLRRAAVLALGGVLAGLAARAGRCPTGSTGDRTRPISSR